MEGLVSQISNRYIKANKKYLKSYDPKHESKHYILRRKYFVWLCNSKFLPTKGVKWIDPKGFFMNKYTSKSSKSPH